MIETSRLRLRKLTRDDSEFILRLTNEPSFIQNIGDRNVRNLDDAWGYIEKGPLPMYEKHGFGLLAVEEKETGERVGMCGLIKRDNLEDVDIGFAFFPQHWGKGYATEAARAVMEHGRRELGVERIVAIVSPHNTASQSVLRKLGLDYERTFSFPGETRETMLFVPRG